MIGQLTLVLRNVSEPNIHSLIRRSFHIFEHSVLPHQMTMYFQLLLKTYISRSRIISWTLLDISEAQIVNL
jgi:hypothetical protein